ncbi:MAG: hypothetical protein KF696_02325 [Planctomycetes bacterium]|nr:hypothetical protein [Planctomycetota bacterium]MCW8134838.1 hypothetical protein [Planctomycetota bacterium]
MASAPRYFGLASTTVDSKNRITIPAKFRSRLPVSSDGKTFVYVTIGPDFRHLALFDQISGEQRIEDLTGKAGLPGEGQRRQQQLLGWFEQAEVDKAGRILLPKGHLEYARLKSEVVVSGAGDHLQIFDPQEAGEGNAPVSAEKLDPLAVARIYNSTLPEQG